MNDVVRISRKQAEVLGVLLSQLGRRMYGAEIVKVSGGRIKVGTVYVTLRSLKKMGFVDSESVSTPVGEQGPPRKTFRITGSGQHAFEVWASQTKGLLELSGALRQEAY